MKKINCLFMVLCLLVSVLGLASCDKKYDGTLTVATNCEFAPFEYTDKTGKPIGIDMELAQEIANILNYELVIKDMDFNAVIAAVEAKQANIAMAGLTISEDREKSVDFCTPYFNAQQVVIGKKDSDAVKAATYDECIKTLEGKKIGFQNGTVAQYFVEGDEGWGFDGITGATATGYTSGATAVLALKNGQIDYVIIDRAPATKFVENNTELVLSTVNLTDEKYAFAVQKGDTDLVNKVNAALATLRENGKFDEIVSKYYSQEN